MYCVYPTGVEGTFPLVSFEHGDFGGGFDLRVSYSEMMKTVASSGFVICAPTMCFYHCRAVQHIHQQRAIVAAKALGTSGVLPVRREGPVGVAGHSTGGMATLRSSYRDAVAELNIGAAVAYNGDGGAELANDNITFDLIDPLLPMFLITGTADWIEPKDSTQNNSARILRANPEQPLLGASITYEGHLDPNWATFLHPAPLRAVPFVIAFLGYTLTPPDACSQSYQEVLDGRLRGAAPAWYENHLFQDAQNWANLKEAGLRETANRSFGHGGRMHVNI